MTAHYQIEDLETMVSPDTAQIYAERQVEYALLLLQGSTGVFGADALHIIKVIDSDSLT